MPKEFMFRGKTLEELKAMDTREFAKYLGSDSRRSALRHFEVIEKFVSKCNKNSGRGKQIRTHQRDIVFVPNMVDYTVYIHNGKEFVQVKIIPEMIGHRLGEFSATRKKVEHGAPGIGATKSSAALSVK